MNNTFQKDFLQWKKYKSLLHLLRTIKFFLTLKAKSNLFNKFFALQYTTLENNRCFVKIC